MRDLKNNIAVAFGINATLSGTTPANGNLVDMQGFDSLALVLQTGVVTDAGTAAGFTVKLQEGDTTAASGMTDVTGATLTVTADTDDSVAVGVIGYTGGSRYVRCVVTGTTGTAADIMGTYVKYNGAQSPLGVADANIAAT